MQSLNLNKGDLLNLTKDYSTLNNINMGLGRDIATKGQSWDLDSIAVMLDSKNKVVDTVSFRHKNCVGIFLNGDNMTGQGEGDDEVISVTLSKIPSNVVVIGFFANIYNARERDFSGVKNAYIRMVNKDTNKEIAKYNLNENGRGYNAYHFANLVRRNNEWEFIAVGKGANGSIDTLESHFQETYKLTNSISTPIAPKEEKVGIFGRLFGKK